MSDSPILVNNSALWGMVAALARDALKIAGTSLAARGVAHADAVDQVSGIIVALIPIAYSQLKTLWNHRKLVKLAEVVPNSVAQVKL